MNKPHELFRSLFPRDYHKVVVLGDLISIKYLDKNCVCM